MEQETIVPQNPVQNTDIPPYDPSKGIELMDHVKDALKRFNGYKYMSVAKCSGDESGLALVVAHKEFPSNQGGLVISEHSKFVDAVVVEDKDFAGVIINRKGETFRVPEPIIEEMAKCAYCGSDTPKSMMGKDACLACLEMEAIVSKCIEDKEDKAQE